jgi:sugar O-acyltransferase (sialic acid O-acetyltransferase NeuD family)
METILVPLINANERELELSEVHVTEGQQVTQGQLLFVVESTKASLDVEAPRAGYVRRLTAQPGQRLLVGAPLCVLTDAPDSALPAPDAAADGDADGARVTRKARALAEAHGLDLALLRVDGIIKTEHVQAALDARAGATARPALGAPQQVVVWGGGGHARALVDLIRAARPDLHLLCAVDDAAQPAADVLGVPIRGTSADLPRLRADGAQHAALGIGAVTNNSARADLFARLDGHGFSLPSWVHRRAIVEPSARMGRGCQIFPGAVVGSNVQLGDNVIVNSGVVLSHDCVIGDHTHLTPGAILAGNVTIGRSCVIGMGVTIYLGVTIGDNVTIANGAHVLRDVPPNTLVKP